MKRKIAIATFTAAALIGGGSVAAFASADDTSSARSSSAQAEDHDDEGGEAQGAKTTAAEAAAAALKTAPGTVTSIDLSEAGKGAVWEVDVTKGGTSHEVRLDGDTNKVLSDKTEKDGDKVPGSKLTAAEVATKAAARGTVTAVEFDDGKSSATWEVETTDKGKEKELTVDGQSGKITKSASGDHEDDDEGQGDDEGNDDD
jgi:uncharacterized membrane protein YkoI